MPKIALVVEYDGTRYHGFQYQENANTVQAELEKAIKRLTNESIRVLAASRTDAGVHAKGQVVSFRTQAQLSGKVWVQGLDYYLPADVAVKEAWPVSDGFDVRRDAVRREYRYSIFNNRVRSPFRVQYAHFFPQPLDIEAMDRASRLLEGEHDLASFTPMPVKAARGTVRTVCEARVTRQGDLVHFSMAANSFLPHQIRHTVGALLQVGRGRLGVTDFEQIVQARHPGLAGPAAPPRGLCLMKVQYLKVLGNQEDENI
ncbi:MAG: tRNA pseudouridine(38-40) synthase TruA [Chloroflexi bacterium]|nr:tRNA pseudouridine(38-40) synthase TruA [Chloroflexota bacterium]